MLKKAFVYLYSLIFLVINSVVFWFIVNSVICLSVLFLRFLPISEKLSLEGDFFNVAFGFSSGGLISFLFYYLVVYLPETRKSTVLKRNIMSIYRHIREDVVVAVVMSSMKGGRSDLSGNYDELIALTDVKEFKGKFSSGKEAYEGFYAFENQMLERSHEFEIIIKNLKLLASQFNFFLHNYSINDHESFDLLKGFELRLSSLEDVKPGYDESKPLCGFIYQWLAGWDPITGYRDSDKIFETLKRA